MKNNICFKLFTLVFAFFLIAISTFAQNTITNVLTKVVIEPSTNNSYNLSLYFNNKFEGNAFLQKKKDGTYFVFIPDTQMSKKTKVIYTDGTDRKIVNLSMEAKPFIKENTQSNYVKLTVNIANDYAIRLLSKTEETKDSILPFVFLNLYSLATIVLIAVAIFLFARMFCKSKNSKKIQSYTHFPSSYLSSPQEYIYSSSIDTTPQKPILPKVNIKKNLKNADSDSFSCFDIPLVDDVKTGKYEFKSTLKQTSNILKEKASTKKTTNPIKKTFIDESSDFDLPIVEELPTNIVEENNTNNEPELLSVLNLTPNKGFYLTTVDDTFALFGFVGDNVFLLKKFSDLSQINLQARFYDRSECNDLYIVRMDSYKAMIEISDTGMREMAVL